MSDNTLQYRWIVTIKENLDARLPDFVAGDLLWYPVEGQPKIRLVPDVMVALGRPKGERGSYRQWEEGGIAPQIVFEILSPRNSMAERVRKGHVFALHGVREFYAYDPRLRLTERLDGWVSPLLGIRFARGKDELVIYDRDGQPFWSVAELEARARSAEQRAASAEKQARSAEKRAARLAARLRAMGVDPDLFREE